MYPKIYLALLVSLHIVLLSACATIPKPTSTNPATITMNFTSQAEGFKKQKSVLTYWRKLNDDGTKGKPFAIGGANAFNRAISTSRFRKPRNEVVKLDSGTYYLDSFEIETKKHIAISQEGSYAKRNGWDNETNAPLFLSFSVADGENLTLPQVIIYLDKNNTAYFDLPKDSRFQIGRGVNLSQIKNRQNSLESKEQAQEAKQDSRDKSIDSHIDSDGENP